MPGIVSKGGCLLFQLERNVEFCFTHSKSGVICLSECSLDTIQRGKAAIFFLKCADCVRDVSCSGYISTLVPHGGWQILQKEKNGLKEGDRALDFTRPQNAKMH